MRYYRIEISPPDEITVRRTAPGHGGFIDTVVKVPATSAFIFTSHPNGKFDPGALNIELDVFLTSLAEPSGEAQSFVRLSGISIKDISDARDFNDLHIKVYAGMAAGLPLANPAQSGLILQGVINQAFGNWIGTEMTLDFLAVADSGTVEDPKNIVLDWPKGTPLGDAVKRALATPFPDYTITVSTSPDLVLAENHWSYYKTVAQLSQYVEDVSRSIITADTYPGVSIILLGKEFTITDYTNGEAGIETVTVTAARPKAIAFQDLVGQPTWVGQQEIQVTCVMRGDIRVGDSVTLPPGQTTTLPQSLSQYRERSVFQGVFQVIKLRHLGNYRQPDGESWITTLDCVPASTTSAESAEATT